MAFKFNVGDQVRIINYEPQNTPREQFVSGMERYLGMEAEITKTRRDGVYSLAVCGKDTRWGWDVEWLIPIDGLDQEAIASESELTDLLIGGVV